VVLHPVGSLPPGAYWLRRLLVLVALVAVVAGGWWLFGRLGSSNGSPTASSSSGPGSQSSTPAANTSSAPATHTATGTPSASHSPSGSPSPTATPTCASSAIKVRAQTDASTYAPGVQPHLTIQVSNTGVTACQRDLGQAALELVVSTGTTRAWSSDDCNPGGAATVVTLRPGQTFSSTVVWDRHRSQPGCPTLPLAKAGSYQLVARNLTLHSAPAPFELR
jgi:cytoskeletal protein RodZ